MWDDGAVVTTDDQIQIRNLVSRYNLAIDSADVPGVVSTFVDGGIFEGETGTYVAPSGLEDLVRQVAARARDVGPLMHWVTNIDIVSSPTGATMTAYLMVVAVGESAAVPFMVGTYHDDLVRTPEGWRFRHRRFRNMRPKG